MLSTAQLPEAAIVIDDQGTVHEGNALGAECLGVAARELPGRLLADLMPDAGWVTEAIDATPADGIWRAAIQGRRRDGTPFPLDASGRRIEDGPPARYLVTLRDRNVDGSLASLAMHYFDAAFDQSPLGMALYSTDGHFVRVNDAMTGMLGRDREELLGMRDQELTHPDDRRADLEAAELILAGARSSHQTEKRFLRPDGQEVWVIANLSFLRDEHGRPISWLGQFQDVTEHRALAERDMLTQLYNRRRFGEALAESLSHSARYHPSGSLVLFDLDGFKAVNDGHGHAAGDQVLTAIARAVTRRARDTDVVARLGGDEFAVILPHTDADGAERFARSLVGLVKALRFDFAPDEPLVTVSVGVAPFADETDPEPVVGAADRALYEVKRAGGDGFAVKAPVAS
ncbi:MAG TPA: diguanylate cyclase [Thermoleophilaceae bacterium]|nr:diguanylate cyclase [Thermoleophilaceae bacterium]